MYYNITYLIIVILFSVVILITDIKFLIEYIVNKRVVKSVFERTELLYKLDNARSNFISYMSHELRTPLNAIIGMVQVSKLRDTVEGKEYCINNIETASNHLLGIINKVLDISKIEANKFEISNVPFNLRCVISDVCVTLKFKFDELKQELLFNVDSDVPQSFLGDPTRLAQVIFNLLGNANKFTPEGGLITIDVVRLSKSGNKHIIQISVKDTGIGIVPEILDNLFKPYEQADTSVYQKYGGTGLGLAITKVIVELMGGEVWVESELGKGSKFTFTVALEEISALPLEYNFNEQRCTDCLHGINILIVDDVDINREIVISLLGDFNMTIEVAGDGSEAVEKFNEFKSEFDIILMDIQMPVINGYDATRSIRYIDSHYAKNVPIIAMTANVYSEDIQKCLDAGMTSHIGKPIDSENLINLLIDTLNKD
jgi:signal transduction histidine kinase